MRVYSLTCGENEFLGLQDSGGIIDLTRALAMYDLAGEQEAGLVIDMEELIQDGRFNRRFLGEVLEFIDRHGLADDLAVGEDGLRIGAPLYPGKIIALGHNYLAHIHELGNEVPTRPTIFGKWPSVTIGHGDAIIKPPSVERMDYEAELAFVVGRSARHVPVAEAMQYVAGYTCMNDVTARDLQAIDRGKRDPWMQSKNFDTFAPLGPCVLVAEEGPAPVFEVNSMVNGDVRQNGTTSDFLFDIPQIIEYITSIMTLEPGDVVSTGTPKGVGPLEPGDTVEVACTGIGSLVNPVIALQTE